MEIRRAPAVLATVLLAGAVTYAQSSSQESTSPAGTTKVESMPVTLVGCLQSEADYRKTQDIGRGGALNTGLGTGDEFVLINASSVETGAAASANIDCTSNAGGQAYELTGAREDELKPLVGHVVRISGTREAAKVQQTVGTSGTTEPQPTGGFDPLNRDLQRFEVNVTSFEEVTAAAAAAPAPAAVAPAPAPEPVAAAPEPAPAPEQTTASAQREELPRTASSLPLVALFGLVSLAAGLGLRLVRD